MMLTPNKRIGQVSHGPYRGATYCRVSVPQDSGIPLAIKANLSGFHDYDLPKGTWVEVSRIGPGDARHYKVTRVFQDVDPAIVNPGDNEFNNFRQYCNKDVETTAMPNSNERIRFFLGCRYYESNDRLNQVLAQAFGPPSGVGTSWGCIRTMNPNGFSIVCRLDQFARFMILRNAAGIQNGFIDLRAEIITQVTDGYSLLAKVTGVKRGDVKRVLLALAYSAQDVAQRLNSDRDEPAEIDVSAVC